MQKHLNLFGKKKGMTHVFDEHGNVVPCTVISIEPGTVIQAKKKETDGYDAIQVGCCEVVVKDERTMAKRIARPILGHIRKSGSSKVFRKLQEIRLENSEQVDLYPVGSVIGIEVLDGIENVDVRAISKGKGFQGVQKKFGFRGGPASHGSGFHRHAGSCGMRSTPGRIFPGHKMPGRMGGVFVTTKNLSIVRTDIEQGVVLIKGAVPGSKDALICLKKSDRPVKKSK